MIRKFNELTLDVCDYSQDLKMKSHTHEHVAFSFVLQGSYSETIGRNSERLCKKGMLIFHPSDETHSVNFHAPTKIFRVGVNHSLLERLRRTSFEFIQPATLEDENIVSLIRKTYAEFCSPDEFSGVAIEGLTLELFAAIARKYTPSDKNENKIPRWLAKTCELLNDNYTVEISLQTLAENAGVHPVYLARQFRRFYRTSVGEYIRALRVKKASQQLSNTKQSISEIAVSTGFYDQSHFSNVFKKHTGMTPAEFRLNKRAG